MLSRVRAWLVGEPVAATEQAPTANPQAGAEPDTELLQDLSARLQKVARAQSKLSLRLDELGSQAEANHAALLARLEAPSASASAAEPRYDDVLDALDRLDDATRSLRAEHPEAAGGLAAIAARLERFVASRGVVRHATLAVIPDGQRFRVVGTEAREELPVGVVTRVVRSAATRGDSLLREGEVIINDWVQS